ncbi:MAG: ABC transporter permease [Ilumatobacteraceae bacterium]
MATNIESGDLTVALATVPDDDFVVPQGVKPQRKSLWGIFREMPFLVKLGTLWLLFIFFAALYAQLDNKVFNGSLPLADPNLQLNGFNPATGEFGTGAPLEGPSWAHPLGTDALARDSFSRAVHGAYVSVTVAVVSVMCGVIVGGLIGSLVGFIRGKTETVLMAAIDVLLAFPALVLLLALISIFEVRDLFVISFVIGLLSIPAYTRVSRANSLAISNREFVMAAEAIGTKRWKILVREIIPNVLPTLLAYAMVAAAAVVVVEGSLSFLGLSVQLPTSSWGNMINQARRDIKVNFGQVLYPALVLTFTVLALNQVGDFFQRRSSHRGSSL